METETETQEKKRHGSVCDGNGEPARRTRPRSDERAVMEDEVNEFFAILHRIFDAAGGSDRRGGDRTAILGKWRPAFKMEDFEEAAVTANEVTSGGALPVEREIVCIDLNAEPETEGQIGS